MPVGFRSAENSGNDVNATSIASWVPAGADTDDIMVAFLSRWHASNNPAVTAPEGFNHKDQVLSGDGSAKIDIYWKRIAPEDDDVTYTWSWSGTMWTSVEVACLTGGLKSGDPIGVHYDSWAGDAGTFGDTSVTVDYAPGLVWDCYNDSGAEGGHTPPDNFTEVADVDCGSLAYWIPGTSGTHVATNGSVTTSSPAAAVLVAVEPEPEAPSGVTGTINATLPALEGSFSGIVGPSELIYVADYSTGDFSQWQIIQNVFWNDPPDEPPGYTDTYAAAIITNDLPPGVGFAARFEVRDGDIPFGSTERSEVQGPSYDSGGQEGDERWYKWSTKFDPQFPQNHSLGFGLVAQFHDQSNGSPPVGMYVDVADNFWGLRVNEQSSPGVFVNNYILWMTPLDNGNWHEIKLHIVWSTDDAIGLIELWYDGVKQTFTGGPDSGTQTSNVQTLTPGGGGIYYKQGYYRTGAGVETGIVSHFGYKVAPSEAVLDGAPPDITGEIDATLPTLQGSFTGEVGITGTIEAVLPPLQGSFAGLVSVEGVLSANLEALEGSFTGEVGVTGNLSASLPQLEASFTGELSVEGSINASLPTLEANIAGEAGVEGSINAQLPALEASFTGTVEVPGVEGIINAVLPSLEASFTGEASIDATINGLLPNLESSFSGIVGEAGLSVLGVVLDLSVTHTTLDLGVTDSPKLDLATQHTSNVNLVVSVATLNLATQVSGDTNLSVTMPVRVNLAVAKSSELNLLVTQPS